MVVAKSATRRADNVRRERDGLPFINTSPNSVRRLSAADAPDGPAPCAATWDEKPYGQLSARLKLRNVEEMNIYQ
jgi:hypothetical protein